MLIPDDATEQELFKFALKLRAVDRPGLHVAFLTVDELLRDIGIALTLCRA
jgi:hypothetical protein